MNDLKGFLNKLIENEEIELEQLLFYKTIINLFDESKFSQYDKEIAYLDIAEEYIKFYWNLIYKNKRIVTDENQYYYERIEKIVKIYKAKSKNQLEVQFEDAKEYIRNNMNIEYSLMIRDFSKKVKKDISSITQDGFFIKKETIIVSSRLNFELENVLELEEKIAKKITEKIIRNKKDDDSNEIENNNISELDEKLSKIRRQILIKENKKINAENIDTILQNLLEEREEIHLFDLVNNKKFGNGLVTKVKNDEIYEIYFFDIDLTKIIAKNFLKRLVLESNLDKPENIQYKKYDNKFKEGDNVFHDLYGNGIVESLSGNFVKVKFEKSKKTQLILAKILKKIELEDNVEDTSGNDIKNIDSVLTSLIQDDKEIDYLSGKNLIRYPNSISEGFYNIDEVNVYNYLKKVMKDGMIAFGTNEITITRKIGLIINKNKGVFAYIVLDPSVDSLEMSYTTFENIVKICQEKLLKKLLNSKQLFNKKEDYKVLKFPFKFGIVFPNIDEEQIKNDDIRYSNHFLFKDFMKKDIFSNVDIQYDQNFEELSKEDSIVVLERFIPEYTTILFKENNQIQNKEAKIEVKDKQLEKITGEEYEYKVLELEEEQIKSINNLKPGINLTLANPGTGKSVILLSNAYRISKLYNENVLITCYNRNLIDKYKYEYDISGLKANFFDEQYETMNLQIKSFYSLISQIYSDIYGRYFDKSIYEDEETAYNALFEIINSLLLEGKIEEKYKYRAIFIDEIQLFDSKWIDFCYMLLREDGYFQMYGDINQDVKLSRRKGQASWQKTEKLLENYKINYLKKNYRNTIQINDYLNNMLNILNDRLNFYGMSVNKSDYVFDSTAVKNGVKPQIIEVKGNVLAQQVISAIQELKNNYNISYSDICLVFPFEKYKLLKYYPKLWIQQEFNKLGIPYSEIYGQYRTNWLETRGITITTIDSSLGLDFKAVILCGLKPLNTYLLYGSPTVYFLKTEEINKNKEALIGLNINVRKIYTAASRARERLYILNDLGENSLLNDIIMNKDGEDLYDRR